MPAPCPNAHHIVIFLSMLLNGAQQFWGWECKEQARVDAELASARVERPVMPVSDRSYDGGFPSPKLPPSLFLCLFKKHLLSTYNALDSVLDACPTSMNKVGTALCSDSNQTRCSESLEEMAPMTAPRVLEAERACGAPDLGPWVA